jgi:vacuolar-type H+-ATPase subunit D/Vma8
VANPQINDLLKCAYQWRTQDFKVLETKIKEVKSINQKCEKEVAKIRESIMLAKAAVGRDASKNTAWITDKEMDRVQLV